MKLNVSWGTFSYICKRIIGYIYIYINEKLEREKIYVVKKQKTIKIFND